MSVSLCLSLCCDAAVGVLSISDIMFAHNVPAYIAIRKKMTCASLLKLTPHVARLEAESALYESMTALLSASFSSSVIAKN